MKNPSGLSTMSSALPDAVNYHRWILDLIYSRLGHSVLEVGFGQGQYSRELVRHCRKFLAVDHDARCVELLKKELPHLDVSVADVTREDFAAQVGESSFQSIVCLNVLEHIEDDLSALEHLRGALAKDGELLLLVPAHAALFGKMDSIAGHFRRYDAKSLRKKMTASGFEIVRMRYFNSLGGLGWWANSKFIHPGSLSASVVNHQVRFYDRFVQPLARLVDPLTARFFGQSLWAVGRRLV